MKRTTTSIIIVLACLFCSKAFGIKQLVYVSPNASTFRVEPQDDGMVRFTITRDPADARSPQNKSLILVRNASLRIADGDCTLLTAPIAPQVNNDGKLVYVFRVSKEHAPQSVFTISEIEDTRDRSGYLGGGTIFEYSSAGPQVLQALFEKDPIRQEADTDR